MAPARIGDQLVLFSFFAHAGLRPAQEQRPAQLDPTAHAARISKRNLCPHLVPQPLAAIALPYSRHHRSRSLSALAPSQQNFRCRAADFLGALPYRLLSALLAAPAALLLTIFNSVPPGFGAACSRGHCRADPDALRAPATLDSRAGAHAWPLAARNLAAI